MLGRMNVLKYARVCGSVYVKYRLDGTNYLYEYIYKCMPDFATASKFVNFSFL